VVFATFPFFIALGFCPIFLEEDKMFLKLSRLVAAIVCLLGLLSATSNAFMMNYGDFNGSTVMYLDVTESNPGPTALFGAPSIFGDLLDFNPVGFNASSSGAAVIVDAQLNTTIMSTNNQPITQVIFNEAGDYTLAGLGPALANATVGMAVMVDVIEVNGVPQFVSGGSYTMTFAPAGSTGNGSYSLPGDLGTTVPWTGSLSVDVNAIVPGATKVQIVLDNTLTATAANGGSAFIAKKDFRGLTITVPEPATVSILSIALLGLAGLRRRIG
jgi:hypothetical protein